MTRKMVCKVPTEEVFVKNHGKSGSGRTWDWSEAILGGSGPVSCDGQGKAHRKWANGCAGKLFRNDSRIIQV